MNPYRYILRYYIDPGFHEDDRIIELVHFCHSSGIQEVMLFRAVAGNVSRGMEPGSEV